MASADPQIPPRQPSPREPSPRQREPLLDRLQRAIGPLAGGVILDVVDLAMFGPVGLFVGPFLGAAVGWWVSSLYRFSATGRAVFAALAALYITFPLTEVLPVATLISAFARFQPRESSDPKEASPVGDGSDPAGSSNGEAGDGPPATE